MTCVIIAGGKGTRLGLQDIPKSMVEMDGRPLLEHQILLAARYGIRDFIILSGHLADVITRYVRNGERWGVRITHRTETRPMGTAGCLRLAEDLLKERFLVLFGDLVLDMDLNRLFAFDRNRDSLGTLVVHPNDHPQDSDLLDTDEKGTITAFHAKPHPSGAIHRNLVNAAVFVLSPSIFNHIHPEKPLDFGKDIFPAVVKSGGLLRAYRTPEYIKDMGTVDRLEHVRRDVASGTVTQRNLSHPRAAIFLDRDGVIVDDMQNSADRNRLHLLPGVANAVRAINQRGWLAIVITNQPGLAKGFFSADDLTLFHNQLEWSLGTQGAYLDAIYYCPHHPDIGFEGEVPSLKVDCPCRKPKPGLLFEAGNTFNVDMHHSWMIGDQPTDMAAGKAAGCHTLLIHPNPPTVAAENEHVSSCLKDAVSWILDTERSAP